MVFLGHVPAAPGRAGRLLLISDEFAVCALESPQNIKKCCYIPGTSGSIIGTDDERAVVAGTGADLVATEDSAGYMRNRDEKQENCW